MSITIPAGPEAAMMVPNAIRGAPPPSGQVASGRSSPKSRSPGVWRARLLHLLKLALAVALCGWLIWNGKLDLERLLTIPLSADFGLLLALLLGSLMLPACRWWWLLRIQGLREPFRRVFILTWIGYFTALILPGAAGGDLAKAYLVVRRRGQNRARALSTVLADRLLGVYSLAALGSLCVGWVWYGGNGSPAVQAMAGVTLSLFVTLTCGTVILWWAPVRALLLRALPRSWQGGWSDSVEIYARDKWGLAGCIVLSLVSNAMVVASFTLAAGLLGGAAPLSDTFLVGPLVVLANCLPLSPGGIGVAETAADTLFGSCGIGGGAELMVLVRVCLGALSLPGGIVLLVSKKGGPPSESTRLVQQGVQS